jgi:tRNA nucleotidyltransferase (CCA-adding enzyme)
MELIISHNNTDFDGLASMVAAKKLFPEASMVFVGKPQDSVQEFMALYKDSIDVKNPRTIDINQVKKLIIVDTKNIKRIGNFRKIIDQGEAELVVFDHHPAGKEDLTAPVLVSEKVGSTTTLLVERIITDNIKISSFEATLFALGIYEDTGALSFSTTTSRDVRVVAWLLDQGANLKIVRNYMERPLTGEQHDLLNLLMNDMVSIMHHGINIIIAKASISEYISGLDLLIHKIVEFTAAQVVFTVVKMGDRIIMVARSATDAVDVGAIVRQFGGGGHESAASASLKTMNLNRVIDDLHEILKKSITPEVTAKNIMSSPVKTVSQDLSIDETEKVMIRYGHTGFPVINGEKIVGIISRRDIEKARYHGLGHAPVKGFMSHHVTTINSDTSLSVIKQIMIEKDIGRLPVLEDGAVVGIISRSDVLRVLHGGDVFPSYGSDYPFACSFTGENYATRMRELLPEDVFKLIEDIGAIANEEKISVYLVGGMVRDLLLGLPNVDLDLVVEGDGIAFAQKLAEKLLGKIYSHEKFGTANLFLNNGFKIDIATARTEYYEFPAALPTVENGSLKQDLFRRDFTINAMAIGLNRHNWGQLIDFFCGCSDLRRKLIRILYNLSFVEDPTRIIRSIRFEKRYGFTIEGDTLGFAQEAIEQNFLERVSATRLKEEFVLILKEKNMIDIFKRLKEMGVWQRILPELELTCEIISYLEELDKYCCQLRSFVDAVDRELLILLLLCHQADEKQVASFIERYQWSKKYNNIMQKTADEKNKICTWLKNKNVPLSKLDLLFGEFSDEGILYFYIVSDVPEQERILRYLQARHERVPDLTGADLKQLGFKPGPVYRKILEQLRCARLDGIVSSRTEEISLAQKVYKKNITKEG